MPVPISFAQTLDPLLKGEKTVTRRLWKPRHAGTFILYFEQQIPIPALNKNRRCRDSKTVGSIILTHKPYREQLKDMPESDVIHEGFPHLSKKKFIEQFFGEDESLTVWVIRFYFTPNAPN